MVEFNPLWYKRFTESSDEKELLVSKILELLRGKLQNSCLEIGLGTSPYFAERLASRFKRYTIIEKRLVEERLPDGVQLINGDWEQIELGQKFDVIFASHVIYYFKNKRRAVDKIFRQLADGGRAIFVVNGTEADYGPLKRSFAQMINTTYRFTYDELMKLIKSLRINEFTVTSSIMFSSPEELFEILRLSFDSYPREYEAKRDSMVRYYRENVKGNKFVIHQKIIEVAK